MPRDYYNEFDPHAAQWLRNLIARGVLPAGDVDERSIEDVKPDDLLGYRRCHFFAGIGVWAYALDLAGFEGPCWTGSCPCQPFSAAGKGVGFADERHLWPAWHWLIDQCRPATVFGEQVASKDGLAWLDLVHTDLEASGYTIGAADLCAAGIGSPHIRQQLFFVAHSESVGLLGRPDDGDGGWRERASGQGCSTGELGDAARNGEWQPRKPDSSARREIAFGGSNFPGELGDSDFARREGRRLSKRYRSDERAARSSSDPVRPGPTNGLWRDADWLGCTDGKWRPVEPGSQPVVDGAAFRMGSGGAHEGKSRAKMLKGYGNAIVAPLAVEFIASAMDALLDCCDPDRNVFDVA